MISLWDGDLVVYRLCAALAYPPNLAKYRTEGDYLQACEEVDNRTVEETCKALDNFIANTAQKAGLDLTLARFFLSGTKSFRKELDPEYKANRKDFKAPRYLQEVRAHLYCQYPTEIDYEGLEADDLMGFSQTDETVILSLDKDLLQVPGKHYNFHKDEWKIVNPWQGIVWFYSQMLIGDSADNVKGVAQIGPKKSEKLFKECTTEEQLFTIVRELYKDDERFLKNSKLLWIKQRGKDNPVEEYFTKEQDCDYRVGGCDSELRLAE